MREICLSGSTSGMWKRSHGRTIKAPPDERGGKQICSNLKPPRHIPTLPFSTEPASPADQSMSALARKQPRFGAYAKWREGPEHKVAALQPAAREQEPRGR